MALVRVKQTNPRCNSLVTFFCFVWFLYHSNLFSTKENPNSFFLGFSLMHL